MTYNMTYYICCAIVGSTRVKYMKYLWYTESKLQVTQLYLNCHFIY